MTPATPLTTALDAFTLVFLSLGILVGVLFLLRVLARLGSGRALVPAQPAFLREREIDPAILVVLAATAHEALGVPVHIHRVHVHSGRHAGDVWSNSGRIDLMVSHRMEKKR